MKLKEKIDDRNKKKQKNPLKSSLAVGRNNVLLIPFSCLILILI
jgi:hypothetical protein